MGATTSLVVKVRPSARKTRIREIREDGVVVMDVGAPPEKGKANAELLRALARMLGVDREALNLLPSSRTRREKVVRVAGLSREEVLKRLREQVGG